MSVNQTPEQIARDAIDAQLRTSGWAVQDKDAINFHEAEGQAVRKYSTDTCPADYVLFVDGHPVGVIEAKSILKKAFTGRLVPQSPADEPATALLACLRAEGTASGLARKRKTTIST